MAELNFATGVVTYNLNGVCEVSFNPTDSEFVSRVYDAFSTLDKMQDKRKEEMEAAKTNGEIFNVARTADNEMRAIVDSLFNSPVCEKLFGTMNVYAMADGLPVWANLLFAILDEVDSGVESERKKTNPRMSHYLKKYGKK